MKSVIQCLIEFGIENPIVDGELHRCGEKDKYWYVVHERVNGLTAIYGCWSDPQGKKHIKHDGTKPTKQELAEIENKLKRVEELERQEALEYLEKIKGYETCFDHPYISLKKIKCPEDSSIKIDSAGMLFIPIYNLNNEIISYQKISATGKKYCLAGLTSSGFYQFHSKADIYVFCEGFATGASLYEATGYNTICCFGISNIEKIVGSFRQVFNSKFIIAADNDSAGMGVAKKVAQAWKASFAVPPVKGDFNDLYVASGSEAVKKAIDDAVSFRGYEIMHFSENKDIDPVDVADNVIKERDLITDIESENTYAFNGKYYEEIKDLQLKQWILEYESKENAKNMSRTNSILQLIKVGRCRSIPWRNLAACQVPVNNGIYNLQTGELGLYNEGLFLETIINYDYLEEAYSSLWAEVLDRVLGDDPRKIDLLQEFVGYCLMPHSNYKKALWMLGAGHNGKSTILNVIEALIGLDNRASVSLKALASPEKRHALVGKLINIVDEVNPETSFTDEGFKQLVNVNVSISVRQLYKQDYMYRPICKHIFASNHPLKNIEEPVKKRLLLLKFNKVIETTDRDIENKLKLEMPGILSWAMKGAKKLYENNGNFSYDGFDYLEEIQKNENPIHNFFQDKLVEVADGHIEFTRFCNEVREYDASLRFKSPQFFSDCLKDYGIEIVRTTKNKKSARYILGYGMAY
jgi:P4 family phage/plasmid primase-like protien